MRYCIRIFLSVLLLAAILVGCKKENTKDYAASIKDKTWWGQLKYSGKTPEYYSVHFSADSTLTWSQISGDSAGKWTMSGKHLTIRFTRNGHEIKADVSDHNKLINITDNSASSEINSGELIVNPNIPLENTVWKGMYALPYQLSFSNGLKMKAKFLNSGNEYPYTYRRSTSGAVIWYGTSLSGTNSFMGVIVSDSVMKGGDYANQLFELVKQ